MSLYPIVLMTVQLQGHLSLNAVLGKIETIKFLIQSGACVDTQDADQQTALHKAVENKHIDLVHFLMETYPKLNTMKDIKGHCPSHYMSSPKD